MNLDPNTRTTMQARRAIKIEAERQHFIQTTIKRIYDAAILAADTTDATSYVYTEGSTYMIDAASRKIFNMYASPRSTMLSENINDILAGLRTVFPQCDVTFTRVVQDRQGTWHQESKITEELKPFLTQTCKDSIVVDWV